MTQENSCIFCQGPLSGEDICSWCGFSQHSKANLPGTLAYGTKTDVYVTGDVITMDGESTSYLAYDTQSQRKVILKEFLPVSMVAPRDGDMVRVQQGKEVLFKNLMMDFTDLYTTLAKIESKSLQKIYRIFHANGTVYAVMENIKGDTLRQNLIKRGKFYTFKEARWLFQDLFVLMKQLEEYNIAHGGISDETVMVTTENNAVLTGFAIQDLRVKNEHVMYKLYEGFSAPEQYIANRFPGFYTDVFSIAVLFYYSITGKTYSEGIFETRDAARHMPKYALEALKFATKKDPQDRLDNIEDFVLMLDNKATVEKPKKTPAKKAEFSFNKKYIPYIMVAAILMIFF
ncbi:MAG: protein kinase, partial [Oscillospiraceae bacterium]|nr:protein kinase [Oscillospiraceae bacterium]